jgi:hydroxymethylpyrimidine/phosphomethylpyrimidine kinase
MRTALTIAGSDPTGGAGVQADLKTFAAFAVYGLSTVTALTAQSTTAVDSVHALPADFVAAQLEVLAGDIRIDAVKTGMLSDAAIVEAVAATIEELALPNLVVDPVIGSSSGTRLLDDDGVQAMIALLLPRARVVTPNLPEAEALSGVVIRSPHDLREAARRIHDCGPAAVIITGGHAITSGGDDEVVDLLYDGREFISVRAARVAVSDVHGTGCAYAAAMAAGLAQEASLYDAAVRAQAYVRRAMERPLRIGRGLVLDHFANLPPE